jgi:thiosulfate dehydrogenase [quinone] large subunit
VTDPRVRRWGALAAALVGGYLMYVALDTTTDAGTSVWTFLLGLALWVAVAAVLLRFYTPGAETFSADEVGVAPEWRVARFLRLGADAAPLYLGVRLFLGYQWLHAGWGKLTNPAWVETGTALQSYWTRAATVPASGSPPVAYPAYRALLQYMLDNEWYTWFAKLIVAGELLVGLGILLGGLTAVAALGGLLLNFSFMYAGSVSSNPTLILLEAMVIYGWRTAGWWGLDRFLLPWLGTPWGRKAQPARAAPVEEAPPVGVRPA